MRVFRFIKVSGLFLTCFYLKIMKIKIDFCGSKEHYVLALYLFFCVLHTPLLCLILRSFGRLSLREVLSGSVRKFYRNNLV